MRSGAKDTLPYNSGVVIYTKVLFAGAAVVAVVSWISPFPTIR